MTPKRLLSVLSALACLISYANAQCGCPNCQPCPQQCSPVLCVLRPPPPTVCSCQPLPPVFFAPPPMPLPYYLTARQPPLPLQAIFGQPPVPPMLYDVPPPSYFVPPPPPCFCRPQEPCNCLLPPPCSCDALPCPICPPPLYSPPVPIQAPLPPIGGLPCPCAPNVRPCACPPNTYLFRFPFSRSRKMRRYNEKSLAAAKESKNKATATEHVNLKENPTGTPKEGQNFIELRKLIDLLPKKKIISI